MFKSVYEFTKAFSVLFFLSGAFFLFKEMYWLAFLAMLSFFVIKFVDSDWAFDNFKFSNHNMMVIIVTFGLIFVNVFAVYQELRFSPLFSRIKIEDKESYLVFENALYSAIDPCVQAHNSLYLRMNAGQAFYDSDVKNTNNSCYKIIDDIDKQIIPGNLSKELTFLCSNLQDEFKKIAINLAVYKYSNDDSQKPLVVRIKGNLNDALKDMLKIREIMQIQEELDESKKTFIQL